MSKNELSLLLHEILNELNSLEKIRGENALYSIIDSYEKTMIFLVADSLVDNLIKSSPREYLEVYSDYENPLLRKMDFAQRQVQIFIGSRP
jgi:hypothetical protein